MSVADTYLSTVHKIIDSAFKELNITKRDINGKTNFGYGHTQATMRWGSRLHTYKAFLKRIIHLDNIKVVTGATVNKVFIFIIIFIICYLPWVNFTESGCIMTMLASLGAGL